MSSSSRTRLSNKIFFVILTICSTVPPIISNRAGEVDIDAYREKVKHMFYHAYEGYLTHAYPFDELQPLSCQGHDTWGSYSLTLIDAMDTLAVMGNFTEFRRISDLLIDKGESFFDNDINVSVFETNIRIVGGLLSAHLLMHRAEMELEPGWPCSGPLLRMAENVARKILPAFDTPTGMPYGTVNLKHGVPEGETTVTCTACIGTFLVEFASLSRLTGDPIFEKTAVRAIRALWKYRSSIGLLGNHIDVSTGKWTALDSGVGGGIDSYFEYLVKGAVMLNMPELIHMFREYESAIDKYVKRDDWYMWAQMSKGSITMPMFTSLDGYWPSIKGMLGDIDAAMKTLHNFHQVWRQFGFTPEYYNIPKAEAHQGREGYPLRPEIVESAMYLYQATKDPYLLELGVDVVEAIEHTARTSCGYATVKDVRDHRLEDRMESFFLAETTKYLYLLFDRENFIHNNGSHGKLIETPGGQCIIEAGGYIFNTEAHPIDLAAIHCCSADKKEEDRILQEFHDNLDLLSLLDLTDHDPRDEWTQTSSDFIHKRKSVKDMDEAEYDEKLSSLESDLNLAEEKSVLERPEDLSKTSKVIGDLPIKDGHVGDGKTSLDQGVQAPGEPINRGDKMKEVQESLNSLSFTELERNLTRIFLEEFQMEVIMKNISQQIAERLEQEFKETEYESIAKGIAKKLLDASVEQDRNKADEETKLIKTEEEDEQAERIIEEIEQGSHPGSTTERVIETQSKVSQTSSEQSRSKDSEISWEKVHCQTGENKETETKVDDLQVVSQSDNEEFTDVGVKDKKLEEAVQRELLVSEDKSGITTRRIEDSQESRRKNDDTASKNTEEVTNKGSAEPDMLVVHLDQEKNAQKTQGTQQTTQTTQHTIQTPQPTTQSTQHTTQSQASDTKSKLEDISVSATNPTLEKFKEYLETQLQKQETEEVEKDEEAFVEKSTSPLQLKRHNLFSITTKILQMFSGTSEDESKSSQPSKPQPSLGGLYRSLSNYSLQYFHDPLVLHCPAQAFHSRVSVYGEMFPDY